MFPFGADPDWRLRAAGAAATLVFVLHGFVDVSGHRLGTVFPAIFLGACALTSASFASKPANYLPRIFRGLGVILVIVGAAWVIAATAGWELPGKIGAGVALEKAQELNTTGHYGESAKEAERALKWAPLDWRLHYQRAVSEISGQGSVRIALDHFRLARFLNPANVELPLKEGEVWMERNPALALPAWEEALSRAGERRKELYAEMLAKSQKASPRLAKAVETLAEGDTTLMCVALLASGTDGFGNRLNQLLANDPFLSSLSGEEQKALFRSWRSLGQGGEFLQQMQSHPEWMKIGWASAANLLASKGQFQRAYELAQSFVKAPALPETTLVDEPVRELRQAILSNPQSYLKGYALYVRQIRAGQEKEALVSLQRITSTKNCPNYFWFLQARLLAKVGDFKEAWGALSRSGLTAP
jgi:tetratricopeptide (TPR) repeat protein